MHTTRKGRATERWLKGIKQPGKLRLVTLGVLIIAVLAACGGGGGGSAAPPQTYTLGGSVGGLSGTGLRLQNGSGTPLAVSSNGAFSFPDPVTSGTTYAISVATQPTGPSQTCVVSNGTGTAGANVTSIGVSCSTNVYKLGGTASGLIGQGLTLQQGSAVLAITSNGSFTYPASVASGTAYSISVASQPTSPSQTCSVGGGSGTVGTADIANVTVTCVSIITADNAGTIAGMGNAYSETVMQLASFLGERLTWLSGHLAATATETCSDPYHEYTGGQAAYAFTDNDGSGSLTTGDVVTITLTDCLSQSMADHVSGTVTLTLIAPTQVSTQNQLFAVTASFNPVSLTGLQVTGSLDAQYTATETLRSVHATAGSSPLQLTYTSGGWFQPDIVSVTAFDISKAIDYTVPRYSVLVASSFQSQTLGGPFSISTPTALGGRLGTYPDAGMEVFQGGVSTLQYAAQSIADNEYVTASLDAQGTGTFSALAQTLFWEQGFNGFAWWEPRGFSIVAIDSRPSYSTTTLGSWVMALLFTEPQTADPINQILSTAFDVTTPIKLFFSGPVDPSNASIVFTPASYIVGQSSIPAVLSIAGPIVNVAPTTQLQHGEEYTLQTPTRIQTLWSAAVGALVQLQLTTLNNLQANADPSPGVAAPGQTVQLLATGSFSNNSIVSGYSWTQTGGTAVSLVNANTATASFVVPASAQSGDSFHFNLTITDANGETDTAPVTIFALTDLTQPFLYYRQEQGAAIGQNPELAVLESPTNGSIRTELGVTPNLFRFIFTGSGSTPSDELEFFPGNGVIAPGTYTNANTTGGLPFSLNSLPLQCANSDLPNWQFTIYEAQAAGDGTAAKFSADFEQSCPAGVPTPFIGSVRVNSTVPLP